MLGAFVTEAWPSVGDITAKGGNPKGALHAWTAEIAPTADNVGLREKPKVSDVDDLVRGGAAASDGADTD
jgi:hypothetical protein